MKEEIIRSIQNMDDCRLRVVLEFVKRLVATK